MASDLDGLLARAAGDLERAVPALPDAALGRVRTRVRRRRVRRHAVESVAGVAGVAAVGTIAWLGAVRAAPAPAESPTMTATTSPTETPTPTPTPTPSSSPTSDVAPPTAPEDDEAGIAKVMSPTTGETWQKPVEDPAMALRLTGYDDQRAFLVGHRGDASIYALAQDDSLSRSVEGLYEVVGDQVTLIECPASADRCSSFYEPDLAGRGIAVDRTTHYDSLTVPTAIRVSATFGVTLTFALESGWDSVYGHALLLVDPDVEPRTLRQLGGGRLVELRMPAAGVVPGLTPILYAYVTPAGGAYRVAPGDVAMADPAAFQWDDGMVRPAGWEGMGATAPGARQCGWSDLAIESGHVDTDWRPAGTARDGRRIYVPVPGGNAVSHAVFVHERDASWGQPEGAEDMVYGAEMYPLTEEQFLDQHSLYAVQGPDGEWLLGLRADAAATVYECA
ncbi:hypothetical protein [Cellulomonas sp. URHB0016]